MRVFARSEHVVVEAPAKVNLFLEVFDRRPDGFHEIDTLFQAVSVYDRLWCGPGTGAGQASSACRYRLEVEGGPSLGAVPRGEGNLVVAAAQALAGRTGARVGARIRLKKGIPVSAGLGGGSSDAAAALVALNRLWGTGLSDDDLRDLAAGLGSDVAFFVRGGTARGRGRGERLEPLDRAPFLWYVILWPGVPVRTADVYRRFDEQPAATSRLRAVRVPAPEDLVAALSAGEVGRIGAATFNRLEAAAVSVEPAVGHALAALRGARPLAAHVSGSGSAVFGIFETKEAAERAATQLREARAGAARLSEARWRVWVAHTEVPEP